MCCVVLQFIGVDVVVGRVAIGWCLCYYLSTKSELSGKKKEGGGN